MDAELTYLAAGRALGKLSDEEHARALELLDSDPDFRVLAREFDETVPGVDNTIGSPPSDLPLGTSGTRPEDPSQRQRASEPIQQNTGDSSESDQPRDHALEKAELRARRGEGAAWLWGAVAAVTVFTTIVATMGLWDARLGRMQEVSEAESATYALATLLSASDLETVTVDATDDLAFRVSSSVENQVICIELLGDAPDGEAAQAWLTDDASTRVAGVVDSVDPLVPDGSFESGDMLIVTIEPLGGSPSPTTEPIASVEL